MLSGLNEQESLPQTRFPAIRTSALITGWRNWAAFKNPVAAAQQTEWKSVSGWFGRQAAPSYTA